MLKLLSLAVVQCLFLVAGQVLLKIALVDAGRFSFTWKFFKDLFTNWAMVGSGICMLIGSVLWSYVLKHYEFSVAHPLVSISYIFGMLASIVVFHEQIPPTRWIGILLIMVGVILTARGTH